LLRIRCRPKSIPETVCHALKAQCCGVAPQAACRLNMCDNCHRPHDTSNPNSCASAQRGMLLACVSTHSNFFPLNTSFYPALHITSLSLLLFITLFFTRMKSTSLSLSLSCCSFYLLLLLNFQTHYVCFFISSRLHSVSGSV